MIAIIDLQLHFYVHFILRCLQHFMHSDFFHPQHIVHHTLNAGSLALHHIYFVAINLRFRLQFYQTSPIKPLDKYFLYYHG